MKEKSLEIEYNSFTYEFKVFNKEFNKDNGYEQSCSIIEENREYRLEVWLKKFLEKYREDINEDNFILNVKSTEYELNNIAEIVNRFNEDNNTKITLKKEVKEIKESPLSMIKDIIEEVRNKNKDNFIHKYFKEHQLFEICDSKIKEREAQILVTATMSAGKSTLINALLGKDLLPSKNEACTATICEIKDNDNITGFKAKVINEKGEVTEEYDNIDLKKIEGINDCGNEGSFLRIKIEGDIKNISSETISTVLIDSPGPNNSQNENHKQVVYNFFKDSENKPLILYVLNVTQLSTNDDNDYLKEISEYIKNKGESVQDRFIFILNKIDQIDIERENLDDIINNTRKYLEEKHKIHNPKIFPMSSVFAKILLLKKEGEKISRSDEGIYEKIKRDFLPDLEENYKGIDIIQYAPIKKEDKETIYKEIEDSDDDLIKCLHLSGLSSLQKYISEYIENVHEIKLVHDLWKQIKDHVYKIKTENTEVTEEDLINLESDIIKSDDFLKKGKQTLNDVEKNLEQKSFPLEDIISRLAIKTDKEFTEIRKKVYGKSSVQYNQALSIVDEIKNEVINLSMSLQSTCDNDLKEKFNNFLNKEIIAPIKNTFEEIVEKSNLSEITSNTLNADFNIELNSSLSRYKIIRKITIYKEVSDSYWLLPWTWFNTKKVPKKIDKEVYDVYGYFNNEILPAMEKLEEAIANIRESTKKDVENLKEKTKEFIDIAKNELEKTRTKIIKLKNRKEVGENQYKEIESIVYKLKRI